MEDMLSGWDTAETPVAPEPADLSWPEPDLSLEPDDLAEPVLPDFEDIADEDEPDALVQDGMLVGDPAGNAEHWFHQAANGFCVPSSVAQVVSAYTGIHFDDEQAFVEQANRLGVFVVGPDGVPGITLDGALTMLADAGVPAHIDPAGTVEDLVTHLDAGDHIILALDSGEIWHEEVDGVAEDNQADHAVVLTGIDAARNVAILSDPGSPTGNMYELPLDEMVGAWEDAGFQMLVTDAAPPEGTAETTEPAEPAMTADQDNEVPIPVGDGDAQILDDVQLPPIDTDGPIVDAAQWVGTHPYVLLPIALGAGALVTASASKK